MKKWIFFLFASCLSVSAQANEKSPTTQAKAQIPIQVLLEKESSEALLEVKGPYYLLNPHDGSRIASGLLGKRFMIRELENGLKWGEEFPGIHQFLIKPRSKDTAIFVNGIQYSGSIAVYGVSNTIHIINEVDIEDYVKSVLTASFTSSLEPEVLSALAILIRTDAHFHAAKNDGCFWHISSNEISFAGSALIMPNSPIERAVDSTRNLILVHREEGKEIPFATAWTEHSAGKTASYDAIFRKDGTYSGTGVHAPHAHLTRLESKWNYKISKKTLANLLGFSQINSVETYVDQKSEKVYAVRVQSGEEVQDIDFFELQDILGKTNILSSDFSIQTKDDTLVFSGFGKGHGVGLCLYSASALAQNGENAVKILSKFYPETHLHNMAIPLVSE